MSADVTLSFVPGRTSLIYPTYNPGPEIQRTRDKTLEFLRTAPGSWEVLFVCDGCTDGTTEELRSLSKTNDAVRILEFANNRGKGFAVQAGLRHATGEWRIFTDVDLSYGLDGVLRVAEHLWQGMDVVVGSRMLPDSTFVIPAKLQDYAYRRRIQSLVYATLVKRMFSLPARDTQAGLKGLSVKALEQILPKLVCPGFSFDAELLLACQMCGFEIIEVPVHFVYNDHITTTNLARSVKMLHELWQIRQRMRAA